MPLTPELKACLDILSRTPPADAEQNLAGLVALLRANDEGSVVVDELMQRVDVSLKEATDPSEGNNRKFLLCEFNRDGGSYRSPWSNTYDPPYKGLVPSEALRALEQHANELMDTYRQQYYGNDSKTHSSVSSVYLWDREDDPASVANKATPGAFAGSFLLSKTLLDTSSNLVAGSYWNSIHVVDVHPVLGSQKASYKLTTTILFSMQPADNAKYPTASTFHGSLSKQMERTSDISTADDSVGSAHLVNIGTMIEEMELDLRKSLDSLYILKTHQIVESVRKPSMKPGGDKGEQAHTMMLNEAILSRGNK